MGSVLAHMHKLIKTDPHVWLGAQAGADEKKREVPLGAACCAFVFIAIPLFSLFVITCVVLADTNTSEARDECGGLWLTMLFNLVVFMLLSVFFCLVEGMCGAPFSGFKELVILVVTIVMAAFNFTERNHALDNAVCKEALVKYRHGIGGETLLLADLALVYFVLHILSICATVIVFFAEHKSRLFRFCGL